MFNTIKKFTLVLALGLFVSSFSFAQDKTPTTDTPPTVDVPMPVEPVQEKSDAKSDGKLYGSEAKSTATVVAFSDLMAAPESFDGKEVVVKGNVNDVCQA